MESSSNIRQQADKASGQINLLEPFIQNAQQATGESAVELIKQALEAHNVFVFGELLDMPNIKALQNHEEFSKYYNLLVIFSYTTFSHYKNCSDTLPPLTPNMMKKLRLLTIVSMATENKQLDVSVIGQEVGITSNREVEDLIIEAIYAGLIRGKLDQKNGLLEVDFAISRDVQLDDLAQIASTLDEWCKSCDGMLAHVENLIHRANNEKSRHTKHKILLDTEVSSIKQKLKLMMHEEDSVSTDNRENKRRMSKKSFKLLSSLKNNE